MQPSDETLAAQAAKLGDSDAFETLMRRHEKRIFHLLQRLTRDRAIAEELCQDTFLRAWRKLGSFEGRGAFAGWLSKLAYNVFLQHVRRRPRPARSLDDPQQAGAADTALVGPGMALESPDLDRLLAAVAPPERDLLILTYAAGLSASEIAAMLGTSTGTVKSQIHWAKEKIRRRFNIEAGND